jgi:sterol desaturase/sphingolipid hydroxylase (fatty acid hydroxylase superfamily)
VLTSSNLWWLVFVCAFVATAACETFWPFCALRTSTAKRWTSNSILFFATSIVLLCAYQLSGIELAITQRFGHFGLLNRVRLPFALEFAVGFAAVDFTAYCGHRLLHHFSLLWRLHQVHHSEDELDLTTGARFHPLEGLFTQGLQLAMISLTAPPVGAVAAAGLATVVQDFFTHANLRLPDSVDRFLASVFITPATHRVHHSELFAEQNGNFGTIFSVWDRLFGTLIPQSSLGGDRIRCGLAELNQGSHLSGWRLLALPFRASPTAPASSGTASREKLPLAD